MVTVWGAPEPYSSFPMSVDPGEWDECVQICFLKYNCILAYSNSSLLCVLYGSGDVRKIRNDKEPSETLEKVSFKIETTNKCSRDPSGMLDGVLSSFKDSKFNTAEIITSENFYEVKIISENITDCGMQIGPEIDCSNCDKTMILYRGTTTFVEVQHESRTRTFYDCAAKCFVTNWCAGAVMMESALCYLYSLDELPPFTRTEDLALRPISAEYSYLAFKYSPPSSNCPKTFASLFSGKHESNFGPFTSFSSYSLTTIGSETSFELKFRNKLCEDKDVFFLDHVDGCYGFFLERVKYTLAAQHCEAMGGDGLMAIPDEDALVKMYEVKEKILPDVCCYFVGFTRADENSEWEWTLPNLVNDDSVLRTRSAEGLKWSSFSNINLKTPTAVLGGRDNKIYSPLDGYICHFPDRKF